MKCQTAKAALQKHLDGTLAQGDREQLAVHLETCDDCRREHDAQHRLSLLADRWLSQSLARSDPGSEFNDQVMACLAPQAARPGPSFGLPLAAAMLLLSLWFLLPGMPVGSLATLAQTLHGLPLWLASNVSALPGNAITILRLPQAYLVPSWTGTALLAALGLNALFCLHARQAARQRSLS